MDKFKVYKETEKTWIVMRKVPLKHIGEFESLKTAREVCAFYNQIVEYVEGLQFTLKNALEVSKEQEKQIRVFKEMAKLSSKQKILEIILWMPFEFHKEKSYSFKQVCDILGMFRDEVADKVKVLK